MVRPFQSSSSAFSKSGSPREDDFSQSDTLFCHPVLRPDICLVRPSISPRVFLLCLTPQVLSSVTDAAASWDSIGARWPGSSDLQWGDNIADIHRDVKVRERQTMEHLFAWGHESWLPALSPCAEYKAFLPLFLKNVLIFSNRHIWQHAHEASQSAASCNFVLVLPPWRTLSVANQGASACPRGLWNKQTFGYDVDSERSKKVTGVWYSGQKHGGGVVCWEMIMSTQTPWLNPHNWPNSFGFFSPNLLCQSLTECISNHF